MPILVFAFFIEILVYLFVSTMLIAGQGLHSYALCRTGTWVCLIFYSGIKAHM